MATIENNSMTLVNESLNTIENKLCDSNNIRDLVAETFRPFHSFLGNFAVKVLQDGLRECLSPSIP